MSESMLAHMVYFTLRDNSPEAVARLVEQCREHLTGHPGCVLFAAGTQTPDLNREVNQSFDVAVQLVFQNRRAQDVYQTSERHQAFIAANKDNWSRVQVFDADVNS